eukprot:350500-Chlamydomonas_euryale.AAC.10
MAAWEGMCVQQTLYALHTDSCRVTLSSIYLPACSVSLRMCAGHLHIFTKSRSSSIRVTRCRLVALHAYYTQHDPAIFSNPSLSALDLKRMCHDCGSCHGKITCAL